MRVTPRTTINELSTSFVDTTTEVLVNYLENAVFTLEIYDQNLSSHNFIAVSTDKGDFYINLYKTDDRAFNIKLENEKYERKNLIGEFTMTGSDTPESVADELVNRLEQKIY